MIQHHEFLGQFIGLFLKNTTDKLKAKIWFRPECGKARANYTPSIKNCTETDNWKWRAETNE